MWFSVGLCACVHACVLTLKISNVDIIGENENLVGCVSLLFF